MFYIALKKIQKGCHYKKYKVLSAVYKSQTILRLRPLHASPAKTAQNTVIPSRKTEIFSPPKTNKKETGG